MTIKESNRLVGKWHRHNKPVVGGLFAVGVERDNQIVGVAIVGRPIARMSQDGWTCEITRVATDGTYNACSMLYGSCVRAAKAMGYRKVITMNLKSESGASLRAAGFKEDKNYNSRVESSWSRIKRNRIQKDLFGHDQRPTEAKIRWIIEFTKHSHPSDEVSPPAHVEHGASK